MSTVKLYDGPALDPNLPSVGLWSAGPEGPHVLYDQATNTVVGQTDDPVTVDSGGVLTVGTWRLGPERTLTHLTTTGWKPGSTYDGPDLPDTLAAVHTTTRVVLRTRDNPTALIIPAGQLRSVGAQRVVTTGWGDTIGFVGNAGCKPCERAARRMLENP